MRAVALDEAERRVEELRAFEREYRSRIRAYLEGLLRDLDAGSGAEFDPADFILLPLFGECSSYLALDCKHCEWRHLVAGRQALFALLSAAQGHECLVKSG